MLPSAAISMAYPTSETAALYLFGLKPEKKNTMTMSIIIIII